MLIYYCVTIIANIVAAFVFYKSINITVLSAIPLFLIALMVFQALFFKNEKVENGFRTKYSSNLSSDEENSMFEVGSKFLFATIPWVMPFIIFFPSEVKAMSIIVYFIGFIGGALVYRIRNQGKINNRMNFEDSERREQERKEELGKWKQFNRLYTLCQRTFVKI